MPSGGPPPNVKPSSDDVVTPEELDFEWNLLDEASGPEFDIDADATAYFMPYLTTVTFKAKALNGSPPFTFQWDFGDGSPQKMGEVVKHTFARIGHFDVWCWGKDANGETAFIQLGVGVHMPEVYVNFLQLDPALLKTMPTPPPELIPTSTPTP
jgi:hypothetical protein